MSEYDSDKYRLDTQQSQGDNLLISKKDEFQGKIDMQGNNSNYFNEMRVLSPKRYNEEDDNTINQFGQSQVKFDVDKIISPVQRVKREFSSNKNARIQQSQFDFKKTLSINEKPGQKNSDTIYQESQYSKQNSGISNDLNLSQKDQIKPELMLQTNKIYNTNFSSIKSSKQMKKKSQKSNQKFMIFIKTLKAFRKFKSFIAPNQVDHTAFRYIKDLASHDSYSFIQTNNQSSFSLKQNIFFNEMQKQTNKFFNLVKGVVVQKNNCRNKLLKFMDHYLQSFDPLNKWKIAFDVILIIATIISTFCKTVEVFFDIEFKLLYPNVYPIISIVIAILFTLDVLLNFNTGVYKKGAISYNRGGRFLLDFISMVSFIEISERFPVISNLMKLLILFKSPLVSQKLEIAQQFAHSNQKMARLYYVIQLLRLILTIFVVAHFVAICFFGQIILSDYLKIGNENNWLTGCGLITIDDPWYKKYIFSLYFSVTTMMTVGYGDISPVNMHEAVIGIISMVIACGVFAYSFNLIGSIISEMNKKDELFKSQMKKVHIYLQDRCIDQDVKYQVLKYLEYKYKHDRTLSKEEEDIVLSGLSASLLSKIEFQTKSKILNKANHIFQIFSIDIRDQLCLKLKEIRTSKEEVIFEQETVSENPEMYFIHRGHIEIYFKNKNQLKESMLNVLNDGQYFGEISFLTNKPRISCARAKEASILFSLSKSDFLSVLENNKQQLEKYHMIHQKLVFGQSNSIISSQCYYCKKETHMTNQCSSVHYSPDKQLVILKQNYSQPITDRDYFPRNRQKVRALQEVIDLKEIIIQVKRSNKSILKNREGQFKRQLTQFQKLNNIRRDAAQTMDDQTDIIEKIRDMYEKNELNLYQSSCSSSEYEDISQNEEEEEQILILQEQASKEDLKQGTNQNFDNTQTIQETNKELIQQLQRKNNIDSINSIPDEEDLVAEQKNKVEDLIGTKQHFLNNILLKQNDHVINKVRYSIFNKNTKQHEKSRQSQKKTVTILKHNRRDKNKEDYQDEGYPNQYEKKKTINNSDIDQSKQNENHDLQRKNKQKKTQLQFQKQATNKKQKSKVDLGIYLDQIQTMPNQNNNNNKIENISNQGMRQQKSFKNHTKVFNRYISQTTQKIQKMQTQSQYQQQNQHLHEQNKIEAYSSPEKVYEDIGMENMREYKYYFPSFNYKNIILNYNLTKARHNLKLPFYLNVYSFANRDIMKINNKQKQQITKKSERMKSKFASN